MKLAFAIAILGLVACSSSKTSKPDPTKDLAALTAEFESNRLVIANQEKEISALREQLRHESAEIDVKDAQSERLFIGPRLGSPY